MKVVPLNDKIVVKRLESADKTAGGILLPDTAKEKPREGKVRSVGNGKLLDNGKRAVFQVKEVLITPKLKGSVDVTSRLCVYQADTMGSNLLASASDTKGRSWKGALR